MQTGWGTAWVHTFVLNGGDWTEGREMRKNNNGKGIQRQKQINKTIFHHCQLPDGALIKQNRSRLVVYLCRLSYSFLSSAALNWFLIKTNKQQTPKTSPCKGLVFCSAIHVMALVDWPPLLNTGYATWVLTQVTAQHIPCNRSHNMFTDMTHLNLV